jgi:hypothetical protein
MVGQVPGQREPLNQLPRSSPKTGVGSHWYIRSYESRGPGILGRTRKVMRYQRDTQKIVYGRRLELQSTEQKRKIAPLFHTTCDRYSPL